MDQNQAKETYGRLKQEIAGLSPGASFKDIKNLAAYKALKSEVRDNATTAIHIPRRHMGCLTVSDAQQKINSMPTSELKKVKTCGKTIAPILKYLFSEVSE